MLTVKEIIEQMKREGRFKPLPPPPKVLRKTYRRDTALFFIPPPIPKKEKMTVTFSETVDPSVHEVMKDWVELVIAETNPQLKEADTDKNPIEVPEAKFNITHSDEDPDKSTYRMTFGVDLAKPNPFYTGPGDLGAIELPESDDCPKEIHGSKDLKLATVVR